MKGFISHIQEVTDASALTSELGSKHHPRERRAILQQLAKSSSASPETVLWLGIQGSMEPIDWVQREYVRTIEAIGGQPAVAALSYILNRTKFDANKFEAERAVARLDSDANYKPLPNWLVGCLKRTKGRTFLPGYE